LKHITATFLRGLATVLPIVLTVYVLYWLAISAEALLGRPLRLLLPAGWYWPGLGIVAGALLVFVAGLAMELYVARRLLGMLERLVLQVPVVKTVYSAIKDFAGFVSESSRGKGMGQVVRVRVAENMHLVGFVTREDFRGAPGGVAEADTIAVYLPMSYQIGGYTVLLPRRLVEPVDMSVEDALRFAVTAGMSKTQGAYER
jgi:uncharacterized membrane protein